MPQHHGSWPVWELRSLTLASSVELARLNGLTRELCFKLLCVHVHAGDGRWVL